MHVLWGVCSLCWQVHIGAVTDLVSASSESRCRQQRDAPVNNLHNLLGLFIVGETGHRSCWKIQSVLVPLCLINASCNPLAFSMYNSSLVPRGSIHWLTSWIVNFIKWYCTKGNCILHRIYLSYRHKTKTIAFTIVCGTMRSKFCLYSAIIASVSIFGLLFILQLMLIYWQCASAKE